VELNSCQFKEIPHIHTTETMCWISHRGERGTT